MTNFHIISLFPDSFDSYFNASILGRAIRDKKIKVNLYNPRDFSHDKNHRIDQKPYGGGPGMVIEALPVIKAVEKAVGKKKDVKIFFLSPGGRDFDNKVAREVAKKYKHIVFICGRYEGIDERVCQAFKVEKISVGPYVMTGGELGAMIMVDVISRQIPGILGEITSLEEDRVSSHEVYTRPSEIKYKGKKYKVPEVLLTGHHKNIDDWRENK